MKAVIEKHQLSSLFKALGESHRLAILDHLCQCAVRGTHQLSVSEIGSCCDLDLSVVSRHLCQLKVAGVLQAKKEGKEVRYSGNASVLAKALRNLADTVQRCCQKKGVL